MATAFQPSAFQNSGFQIDNTSDVNVLVTGQQLSASQGSVTVNVDFAVAVTGQQLTASVNDVFVQLDPNILVTGQQLNTALDNVTVSTGVGVSVVGQLLSISAGTIAANYDFAVSVTGLGLSTGIGYVEANEVRKGRAIPMDRYLKKTPDAEQKDENEPRYMYFEFIFDGHKYKRNYLQQQARWAIRFGKLVTEEEAPEPNFNIELGNVNITEAKKPDPIIELSDVQASTYNAASKKTIYLEYLKTLTTLERLERIEEWIYDHRVDSR